MKEEEVEVEEEKIFKQALSIAKSYDPDWNWNDWADNAKEDFWNIACDDLGLEGREIPNRYC